VPDIIAYFVWKLPTQKERSGYVFNKWLNKILCFELGDYGLTYLPRINSITQGNLGIIYQAFVTDNEFSLLVNDCGLILNKFVKPVIWTSNCITTFIQADMVKDILKIFGHDNLPQNFN
jgi:hypothetical protein